MGRSGNKSRSVIFSGTGKIQTRSLFAEPQKAVGLIKTSDDPFGLFAQLIEVVPTKSELVRDPVFNALFARVSKDTENELQSPEYIFARDSLFLIKNHYAERVKDSIKNSKDLEFIDIFFDFKTGKHLLANSVKNHLNKNPADIERICYSVLNESLKKHNPDENYLKPLAKVLARKLSEHENKKTGALLSAKQFIDSLPDYELVSIDNIDLSPTSATELGRAADFIETTILFRQRVIDSDVLSPEEIEKVFRERASRMISTYFAGYLSGIERADILNRISLSDIAEKIKENPKSAAKRLYQMVLVDGNQEKFKNYDIEKAIALNPASRIEEVLRLIGLQVVYRQQSSTDTFKSIVGEKSN